MPILAGLRLYCHMPKTGGTTVTRYLNEFCSGQDRWPKVHGHAPVSDIHPRERIGMTAFGTIRDPWSWYASWWMHAIANEGYHNALKEYGNGSTAFPDVLTGVLTPDESRTPSVVSLIWSLRDPPAAREKFLKSGDGLYSWAFDHVYGTDVEMFVRLTHLHEDLGRVLRVNIPKRDLQPTNTYKERSSAKPEWTDEMIEAVWQADAALIDRFKFDPPSSTSD